MMRGWRTFAFVAALGSVALGMVLVGPALSPSSASACGPPADGPQGSRGPVGLSSAESGVALGVVETRIHWTRWSRRLVHGDVAILQGQVVTEDGALPDVRVDLYSRPAGSPEWTKVASTVTSSDTAVFSFPCQTPEMTSDYRVVFEDSMFYAGSRAARHVAVARRVPDALKPRRDGRYAFSGSVSPDYRGRRVVLQRKKCPRCSWWVVSRKQTTSTSRWRFRIAAPTSRRTWSYRAVVPADDEFVRSYSDHVWRLTRG
jgi:hypothetical protein